MEDEEPLTPAVKNAVNFFNSLNKVESKPKPRPRLIDRKLHPEKEENRNIKNTMNLINQINGELKSSFESKVFKPKFKGGSTERLIIEDDDKSSIITSSTNTNKPDLVLEINEKPKLLPKPKPRQNILQKKPNAEFKETDIKTTNILGSSSDSLFISTNSTKPKSENKPKNPYVNNQHLKTEVKPKDAIKMTKSRIETFNSVLILKSDSLNQAFTPLQTSKTQENINATTKSIPEFGDNNSSILIVKSGSVNEVCTRDNTKEELKPLIVTKIVPIESKLPPSEQHIKKKRHFLGAGDFIDTNKQKLKQNTVISSKDIIIPKPKFPQSYKNQMLEDELETIEKIFEGITYSPIRNAQSLEDLRSGENMLEETIKKTKINIKQSMQCLLEFEKNQSTVVKKEPNNQHFVQAFKKSKRSASADDRPKKVKNVEPYDTFIVGSAVFKEGGAVVSDSDAKSPNMAKKASGITRKKGIYKKIQVNVSHRKER